MATITVKIADAAGTATIKGESTLTGHAEELEAVAIRDLVFAPSTSGAAYLSEIYLTRLRDKASPKLAQACAMGENIGTVTISIFRNTETGPQIYMQYTLTDTFVSRLEHETAEGHGGAYLPHIGYGQSGGSNHQAALRLAGLTMNADRGYSRGRARPTPAYPLPMGTEATNEEVERVWFNAATIKWTYTPYSAGVAQGAIEKGWNLQTSTAT